MNEYHILNGDCLLEQLDFIDDQKYVLRECFIDGPAVGNSIEELLDHRKAFFRDSYKVKESEYDKMFIQELNKINSIPNHSIINLWFEYDLFCQSNFWFILNYIQQKLNYGKLYLVTPNNNSWMGFGADDKDALEVALNSRLELKSDDINSICNMWAAYQLSDWSKMKNIAKELKKIIPKIESVVDAHIARFPKDGSLGRPQATLKKLINIQQNKSFNEVFVEFNKSQGIYGFGDLQVKQMFDNLVS